MPNVFALCFRNGVHNVSVAMEMQHTLDCRLQKNVFDEAIKSLLFPLRDTFICHTGMTNKCLFPPIILFSLFHGFKLLGVEKIQHKEFELQFTGATIDINEH